MKQHLTVVDVGAGGAGGDEVAQRSKEIAAGLRLLSLLRIKAQMFRAGIALGAIDPVGVAGKRPCRSNIPQLDSQRQQKMRVSTAPTIRVADLDRRLAAGNQGKLTTGR